MHIACAPCSVRWQPCTQSGWCAACRRCASLTCVGFDGYQIERSGMPNLSSPSGLVTVQTGCGRSRSTFALEVCQGLEHSAYYSVRSASCWSVFADASVVTHVAESLCAHFTVMFLFLQTACGSWCNFNSVQSHCCRGPPVCNTKPAYSRVASRKSESRCCP